jgi:hypothetical protein
MSVNVLWRFSFSHADLVCLAVLIPVLSLRWGVVPKDRKRTEYFLAWVLIALPTGFIGQFILNGTNVLCPWKYDLYVFQIDRKLGNPSFWVGQRVLAHLWSFELSSIVYGLILTSIFGTLAVYLWWRSVEEAVQVWKLFIVNGFGALGFYCIIPVSGPVYAFTSFPAFPHNLVAHRIATLGVPNGIPSVHMSTALLVFWCLRHWRWGILMGGMWVGLTAVATLALGEHYLVDLICAIPYATGVWWLMKPVETDEASETAQVQKKEDELVLV